MQDSPTDELGNGEIVAGTTGLSRRDFMKVAALMTGGMLLILSRYKVPHDPELPPVPPDFKRFVLTEPSTTVASEQVIVALGSQCPDLSCALWWADEEEFQFYERVDQIVDRYVSDGRMELFWLD